MVEASTPASRIEPATGRGCGLEGCGLCRIRAPDTRSGKVAEELRRQSQLVSRAQERARDDRAHRRHRRLRRDVVTRGDIVVVSSPRRLWEAASRRRGPNQFLEPDPTPGIPVRLVTSDRVDAPLFRIPLEPGRGTGLKVRSQVMVDKIVALGRHRLSAPIGKVDEDSPVGHQPLPCPGAGISRLNIDRVTA